MSTRKALALAIAPLCVTAMLAAPARVAWAGDNEIQRYLVGSLHGFGDFHQKQGHTSFHAKPEQGVFVYDINDGHKLVERFPAKLWTSWSHGGAGLAAHAGSGVLFQVEDGKDIRAYDFLGKQLLWERGPNTPADKQWAAAGADHDLPARAFPYIDRRFAVTKDGKHLIVPDRDSAKKKDAQSGKPRGLGVPVVRVLDAQTGEWVKNIALVEPQAADKSKGRGGRCTFVVCRKHGKNELHPAAPLRTE